MAENFQNFFVTKLREACDATATTIYVDTVPAITEGTLVLEYANSTKHEIIHFTGVSGYGLTGCTRGLEGTTAQSHSAGTDVRQNLTAGMIDKLINGVITTENIADGAVTADKIDFTTLGGNYSTSEQDTGFTWVGGQKIYKKTVNIGNPPKSSRKEVSHGITNIDYVIRIESVLANPTRTNQVAIPFASVNNVTDNIEIAVNKQNVQVTTATDYWGNNYDTFFATIYYTKTS